MYNPEPKKRYGQNFLKDNFVLSQIIQSIPKSSNIIVEIGSGLGDLTKELLKVKDVVTFEVDTDLYKILKETFSDEIKSSKLKLINRDVLEGWGKHLIDENYDLVANLPYYIATNIILRALKDENCKSLLVMVQKEVAVKFCSKVNEREFSTLGVLAETLGEANIVFDVAPTAFYPPPKVISSILKIEKKVLSYDEEFEKFLRVCFAQPRKMLLKNLSAKYPKEILNEQFLELNLQNLRPHQVTTSIYHQLYKNLPKGSIDGEFKSGKHRGS